MSQNAVFWLLALLSHPPMSKSIEYLEQSGLTAYFKDVVTLLLENRPERPLRFLSEYFENVARGSSPIMRAYRYIRLRERHSEAFLDNLVAAYAAIDSKTGGEGFIGSDLVRLLKLLCLDFPADITPTVIRTLQKRDAEPVSFPEFVAAIKTCLLYEEFLQYARKLFQGVSKQTKDGQVPIQDLLAVLKKQHGVVAALQHPRVSVSLFERVMKRLHKAAPLGLVTEKQFLSAVYHLIPLPQASLSSQSGHSTASRVTSPKGSSPTSVRGSPKKKG